MKANTILPFFGQGLSLVALRRKGAAPVLAGVLALAVCLPATAHADAFSARNNELANRISALEAQLNELRSANAQQGPAAGATQSGVVAGQPDLSLPPPPEPAVMPEEFEPNKGFTLLAEINGQYFVKDGAAHRLLDAETFERFKKVRAVHPASTPVDAAGAATTPPVSAPPAPPPPTTQAATKPEAPASAPQAAPTPPAKNTAAARNAASKKAAKKAADRK